MPSCQSLSRTPLHHPPGPPLVSWHNTPSWETHSLCSPWSWLTSLSPLTLISTWRRRSHLQWRSWSWRVSWSSIHSLGSLTESPQTGHLPPSWSLPVKLSIIERWCLEFVCYLVKFPMPDIPGQSSTHYRSGNGTADSHQYLTELTRWMLGWLYRRIVRGQLRDGQTMFTD